jgi:DNA end-binding protein Ku
MPTASRRTTWKGAISFGLVHIPIELRSATAQTRVSFKLIDLECNSAVGNKQISKATGEDVAADDIVKGVEVEEGLFVTLTKEEIRAALPKTTQTIEIEAFVDAGSITASYFNKPYHVAPSGKGIKAYELLRATLVETGKIGLAKVVSTKQHIAALMPEGKGMVLELLRWSEEVRTMEGLNLPDEDVKVSPKELQMAEMLVNNLAAEWEPDLFHYEFKEQLQALIDAKAKAGDTVALARTDEEESPRQSGAAILDLSEMLKRSLQKTHAKTSLTKSAKSANDSNVTPLKRAAAKKAGAKATTTVKPPARGRKAG